MVEPEVMVLECLALLVAEGAVVVAGAADLVVVQSVVVRENLVG